MAIRISMAICISTAICRIMGYSLEYGKASENIATGIIDTGGNICD